jgi:hypothetical protein
MKGRSEKVPSYSGSKPCRTALAIMGLRPMMMVGIGDIVTVGVVLSRAASLLIGWQDKSRGTKPLREVEYDQSFAIFLIHMFSLR